MEIFLFLKDNLANITIIALLLSLLRNIVGTSSECHRNIIGISSRPLYKMRVTTYVSELSRALVSTM